MKIDKWWNVRRPFGSVNIQPIIRRSVKSMTAKTAHSQSDPLVLIVMSELGGLARRASLAIVEIVFAVELKKLLVVKR
jgi:hypothetical protein